MWPDLSAHSLPGAGCGYRNLQMQASHLLLRRQVREVWYQDVALLCLNVRCTFEPGPGNPAWVSRPFAAPGLQEARQALFGGCGFVPDIPALQAWLECAWAAGFDRQGSEQLGGRVQATK